MGPIPDWNPAEILGIRPRPLGVSLYKELITDGTWAYQREIMVVYRNLRIPSDIRIRRITIYRCKS